MDDQKTKNLATYLVNTLYAEKIVPSAFLGKLMQAVCGGNAGGFETAKNVWQAKSKEARRQGRSVRGFNAPLLISRGYSDGAPEDELKMYLPEEKIMINRQIFQSKLKSVPLANLTPAMEKALLEELRNESIGLTNQEILLYYNLIKINRLERAMPKQPQPAGEAPQAKTPTPADVAVIQTEEGIDYAETILSLVEEHFATLKDMQEINDGKMINREYTKQVIIQRVKMGVINPKVFLLLIGHGTDKYLSFMVDFMEMVTNKWGDELDDILRYFGIYLLLYGGDPKLIDNLRLSNTLSSFVKDQLGRVRKIYYASMLFIMTFVYVLVTQVFEVSNKFHASPHDQQAKIEKLYNSDERMNMLIQNAFNIASQKILDFRSESRDVLQNIKKFLMQRGDLVRPADIFKTKYNL